jgi:hypothetical protein
VRYSILAMREQKPLSLIMLRTRFWSPCSNAVSNRCRFQSDGGSREIAVNAESKQLR